MIHIFSRWYSYLPTGHISDNHPGLSGNSGQRLLDPEIFSRVISQNFQKTHDVLHHEVEFGIDMALKDSQVRSYLGTTLSGPDMSMLGNKRFARSRLQPDIAARHIFLQSTQKAEKVQFDKSNRTDSFCSDMDTRRVLNFAPQMGLSREHEIPHVINLVSLQNRLSQMRKCT